MCNFFCFLSSAPVSALTKIVTSSIERKLWEFVLMETVHSPSSSNFFAETHDNCGSLFTCCYLRVSGGDHVALLAALGRLWRQCGTHAQQPALQQLIDARFAPTLPWQRAPAFLCNDGCCLSWPLTPFRLHCTHLTFSISNGIFCHRLFVGLLIEESLSLGCSVASHFDSNNDRNQNECARNHQEILG